jgi:PAS domain S-box-containing protein
MAPTLRLLLEGMSEPSFLLNRRLEIVFANEAARQKFGRHSSPVRGRFDEFMAAVFPHDDLSAVRCRLRECLLCPGANDVSEFSLASGGARCTVRVVCVCGTKPALDDPLAPVLAAIFTADESARGLPRVERVLDSSADGVFIVNRDNRIVYFNPACERMTGWQRTPDSVTVHECSNMMHCHTESGESMGSEALCPAKLMATRGAVPAAHEMLITTRTGEEKWIETSYSPIRNAAGEIEYVVGIMRDIDERKRLEAQLAQSRNLAMMGQLVSGIAHEIRNPLGIIMSGVDVILEPSRKPRERREAALFIKDEVRRLDARVRDFLAFARPRPVMAERVDLHGLLRMVLLSYTSQVSERFEIETGFCIGHPVVDGDPDQLRQVFLNLLINADQAMPEGGRLRVETSSDGSSVIIRFCDEGVGIRSEHLPRIFDPFFTTKQDGTGLGLSIAHQIVVAHRGKLVAHNNPAGRGAVFEITLPVARGVAP